MLGIYCRVSTSSQEDQLSLGEQESAGITFAKSLGIQYKVYPPEIESAKNIVQRSILQSVIADISKNAISALWIGDIDRLTRDMEDGGRLKKLLDKHEIKLYDRGKEVSGIEFGLRVVLAEEERKRIIERTRRNRRKQIDDGENTYSSLYGYKFEVVGVKKSGRTIKKWSIDLAEAEMVKHIYDLHLKDLNFDQICTRLMEEGYRTKLRGNWDRGTISNILRRPEYIGMTYDTKGELVPSKHYSGFLDKQLWEQVQSTIDSKIRFRQGKHFRAASYESTGIVRCKNCDAPYFFHSGKRNGIQIKKYYHKQTNPKYKACHQRPKYLDMATIDYILQAVLVRSLADYSGVQRFVELEKQSLDSESEQYNQDIIRISSNITGLEKQKKRLIDAIRDGVLTPIDIKDELSAINDDLEKQNRYLASVREKISLREENLQLILADYAEGTLEKYLRADAIKRREYNFRYIESCKISDYKITIVFRTKTQFTVDLTALEEDGLLYQMAELRLFEEHDGISDYLAIQTALRETKDNPDRVEQLISSLNNGNKAVLRAFEDGEIAKNMDKFRIRSKGRKPRPKQDTTST